MATYVKVSVPDRPEDIVQLIGAILHQHESQGQQSPLADFITTKASAHLQVLQPVVERIASLRSELATLVQKRNNLMGMDESVRKAGTTNQLLAQLRDTLVAAYKGQEREMMLWGFDISLTNVSASRISGLDDDPSLDTATDGDDIGIGEDGVN